jgi:hypothetical protein
MSRLLTGVAVIAMSLSLLAGVAASARPRAQLHASTASIVIAGWGNVTLSKGLGEHRTFRCTDYSCSANGYRIHGSRIALIARPYKGWKFTGWNGACRGASPKCAIHVVPKRHVRADASFVPIAPGWRSNNPIRLGTTASIGDGYQVRVNSVLPNPQLSPSAPPGEAYFAANVTLTYTGPGEGDAGSILWVTIAHHKDGGISSHSITAAGDPPYAAQQPPLDYHHPLDPGHSTTGYICWRVGASEATSIDELVVSSASGPPFRETWFTLR